MSERKRLVISAFENLDANLLEVVLDDSRFYSKVPKSLFLEVYRRFVYFIKKSPEFDTRYQAYSATAIIDEITVNGFIFVNGDGICYLKLAFEESDDDYLDIWQCKKLSTDEVAVSKTMGGISFYDDEKKDFFPDDDYEMICLTCMQEVDKLQKMRNEEGALSRKSISNWFIDNENFFVEYVLPFGYYYSKCAEFINYYELVRRYKTSEEIEQICKGFCEEFYDIQIINKASIVNWLRKVDQKISNAKTGFWYDCNFKKGFFRESHVKMFLPDFYYTQNLGYIMYLYKGWLPTADEKFNI